MEGISVESMYVECKECGMERRLSMNDCRLCEVVRMNVCLREEVRGLKEEYMKLNDVVKALELRKLASVRPKEEGRNRPRVVERVEVDRPSQARANLGECMMDETGWICVRNGSSGRVSLGQNREVGVECRNRFSSLAENESSERENVKVHKRERERTGSKEVIVIGDSQVRYLDRTFCERDRNRRMRVCLPGAGVNDMIERYENLVKGTERDAVVVMHVGINDIKKVRSEELVSKFRELLEKIRISGRRGVVSGVLPRLRIGSEWMSRAIGINERVKAMCEGMGLLFVDEWSTFVGRKELFAMDGLHLSRKGVNVLSDSLEEAVRIVSQGN